MRHAKKLLAQTGDRVPGLSDVEIGKLLGISRGRVYQLRLSAVEKIRAAVFTDPDLRDLVSDVCGYDVGPAAAPPERIKKPWRRNAIFLAVRKLERELRVVDGAMDDEIACGNQEAYDSLWLSGEHLREQINAKLNELPEIKHWPEELWGPRPFYSELLQRLPTYKQLVAEGYR